MRESFTVQLGSGKLKKRLYCYTIHHSPTRCWKFKTLTWFTIQRSTP